MAKSYFEEFKSWLMDEGKDPKTIIAYLYSINLFSSWYEDTTGQAFDPENITPLDIHDWRSYLKNVRNMAQATLNKHTAALKVYWSYLTKEKSLLLNPTKKVKSKRISILTQLPRWLTRAEQAKLDTAIRKEKREWKKIRDLAMAQAMLSAGLRISEVAGLDIGDVELKKGVITVRNGKGGKSRIVMVNRDLKDALDKWTDTRGEAEECALFLSERGGRITDWAIQHQMRKYLDKIALTYATVHSLRHTFCKNLIDQGHPLNIVAQLAGHENLETTRRYTIPGKRDLKIAVESISWMQ